MFDKKRIAEDFSAAAAEYDLHADLQQRVLHNLLDKIRSSISPASHILDAGCGTGGLAKLLPKHSITQLDIAYNMCLSAKKYGNAINADVSILPFANNSFDIVFSSLVLQWVADWQAALTEMQRVLKPGGVLAVATFGEGTLHELKESFASIDEARNVSPFISSDLFECETIVEYYPNLESIMVKLKAIGARNKLSGRSKVLMTRNKMQKIEHYYKTHYGSSAGLPVTWEVLYFVKQI